MFSTLRSSNWRCTISGICKRGKKSRGAPGSRVALLTRAVVSRDGHEDALAADHLAVDLPAVHLAHRTLGVARLGELDVRVALRELGVHRVRRQLHCEHAPEVGEDLVQVLFAHVPRQFVHVHLYKKFQIVL